MKSVHLRAGSLALSVLLLSACNDDSDDVVIVDAGTIITADSGVTFQDVDKNGNGQVSRSEYTAAVNAGYINEAADFNALDADNNGSLDSGELY